MRYSDEGSNEANVSFAAAAICSLRALSNVQVVSGEREVLIAAVLCFVFVLPTLPDCTTWQSRVREVLGLRSEMDVRLADGHVQNTIELSLVFICCNSFLWSKAFSTDIRRSAL